MAITINPDPILLDYQSIYNPIVYTASTTNSAQTNFKFIVDIFLNGSATALPRKKYPVVPGQTYQAIEIGGIIKNSLTRNPFIINEITFMRNSNSILSYEVQIGEEYGPSSGVTAYPNLATTGVKYAINSSQAYNHFILGLANYITGSTSKKFLTNAPRLSSQVGIGGLTTSVLNFNIDTSENYWLSFINPVQGASTNHDRIIIQAYNSSNVLLNTSEIINSFANPITTNQKNLRIGLGTKDLNLLTNISLVNPTAPVLPAATSYYTANLETNTSGVTSEIAKFTIVSKCSKATTTYRLVWLNVLGGYDCFTFYGQNTRTADIDRKMYRKYAGYFDGSNIFTFNNQNSRQNAQYNTTIKDTYKATSDWITDAESIWLEELFSSPDVYLAGATELIPIILIDSSYDFKTTSRDSLFNIEITFQPTFERMRQQW